MTEAWQAELALQATALSLPLPTPAVPRLARYADLLLHWGEKMDLVATRDPEELLEKQVLDSLTGLALLPGSGTLVDLGSGAGLPGLALAIAREGLEVRSVESRGKKAAFQRRVVAELGLRNAQVDERRAEAVIRTEPPPTWITARALGPLTELLELTGPWLAKGAILLAYKGPKADEELLEAGEALERSRVRLKERRDLVLPTSRSHRTLLTLSRST